MENARNLWTSGFIHNIRTRFLEVFTKKREVAEEGSEQVHDEHGQDGDVGNVLHTLLGSTDVMVKK